MKVVRAGLRFMLCWIRGRGMTWRVREGMELEGRCWRNMYRVLGVGHCFVGLTQCKYEASNMVMVDWPRCIFYTLVNEAGTVSSPLAAVGPFPLGHL